MATTTGKREGRRKGKRWGETERERKKEKEILNTFLARACVQCPTLVALERTSGKVCGKLGLCSALKRYNRGLGNLVPSCKVHQDVRAHWPGEQKHWEERSLHA